jgi:hypothetical protein
MFNLERTLELLEAEIAAENAVTAEQAAKVAVTAAASNGCSNGHNCQQEHDHGAHDHTAHDHSTNGSSSSSSCGDAHCTTDHSHSEHSHDHHHKRKHDDDDTTLDAHSSSKRLATEQQHQQQQQLGTVVSTRHDSAVGSLGLTLPGAFDHMKFNAFMKILLDEKSADIYRCKVSSTHHQHSASSLL